MDRGVLQLHMRGYVPLDGGLALDLVKFGPVSGIF